jgi:PAS domain S-box-containing protein
MTDAGATNTEVFWGVAIGTSVILAIGSTIFSLTHGIYEVFPFLYFLPIILFVYRYPQRGVIFSLALSIAYLSLIYYLSGFNQFLVAISTAWFVIFVTIGVVTSSFAERVQAEERKFRGIFEHSQAGIFTFDLVSRRIAELNIKCGRLLDYDPADITGKDLSRILPPSKERDLFLHEIQEKVHTGDHELRFVTRDGSMRQFLVSASLTQSDSVICSIIDITEKKLAEKVIQKAKDELEDRVRERTDELLQANEVLKAEIRERKRFEAAIQLTNRKLSTLASITRHDILNQITAIVMYASLGMENTTDPQVKEQLLKIEQLTGLIQKQIRFTRDYQSIGTTAPSWQEFPSVITEAKKEISLGSITLETDCRDLEVYADLLLVKVFSNLLDNTVRHGAHATKIHISCLEEADSLVIVYEDDGIGIPAQAKEKIFRREYYRNTGYGLFLSEEVLTITGATIRESGVPGTGARFEIRFPRGMYRFPSARRE